jgi:hypothetical protein
VDTPPGGGPLKNSSECITMDTVMMTVVWRVETKSDQ